MINNYLEDIALAKALEALKSEEVFIYPTDTLYGFGGDAMSSKVLDKLYSLKRRPENMPVSMIVRDKIMLSQYAHIPAKADLLIDQFFPGALTLVLPAKDIVMPNKLFSVQGYLGFRIPNHDFCRELSEAFEGPIITTSVNFSGKAPMNNIKSINEQFGNEINLMISDPILDSSTETLSSTVVMISKDESLKVLREGIVSVESINQVLQ